MQHLRSIQICLVVPSFFLCPHIPPQMYLAFRADTLHGISLFSLDIYSIFLKSGHSARVFFYDAMPLRVMVKIKFL